MMYARTIGAAVLLCCQVVLAPGQALAQAKAEEERVDVIVSQPEGAGQPRHSLRAFFSAVKSRIAQVTGHVLPMTRCEKWSVAKKDLEKVKREAAKKGVVVTQLGANWHQLMRVTEDALLDEKQKAMVERARASKATLGVKIMTAPPPAVLEHALTKDVEHAGAPAAGEDHRRLRRQHDDHHRAHQRRHQARHVHLARHGRGIGGAGHAHVVGERQDDRHGAGPGPPAVHPPPGRQALRGGGDGRGSDAAGARGDAGRSRTIRACATTRSCSRAMPAASSPRRRPATPVPSQAPKQPSRTGRESGAPRRMTSPST